MTERFRALTSSDVAMTTSLALRGLGPSWDEQAVRDELARPGALCVGEELAGELRCALLSWIVAGELEINVVVVAENARRAGLGRQLVEWVLSEARARGASQAFLEVRASNAAARALYLRCGFAETGTRRGYYRDGEDAVLMGRTL